MRLFLLLSCLFAVATADAGADADADLLQLLGEETEPGSLLPGTDDPENSKT